VQCPSTGAKNSTKAYKRNSKRSHLLPPSLRCQPKSQYYKPNRTNWKSTVKTRPTPCPKLFTTFDLNTGESQFGFELPTRLQSILANVERLGQTYDSRCGAIDVWQRQIPHLSGNSCLVAGYSSSVPKPKTRIHNIGCSQFSPAWVYWHQQTEKTRHTNSNRLPPTTQQAHARFLAHTHTETLAQQQQWIDWAIWMCAKFQRTSSAVEGRNGYLSRLHHSHRNWNKKVLTVIHNFDLKRDDDTTAAQRLFGKPFPNLFDWVVSTWAVTQTQANSKSSHLQSPPYKLSRA